MRRLAVFTAVSLALHSLLFLIHVSAFLPEPEKEAYIEFTPVSRAESRQNTAVAAARPRPESNSGVTTAPAPAPKPAPAPEPKPAPKPEPTPQPKPETKPEPKPQPEPAPQPEAETPPLVLNPELALAEGDSAKPSDKDGADVLEGGDLTVAASDGGNAAAHVSGDTPPEGTEDTQRPPAEGEGVADSTDNASSTEGVEGGTGVSDVPAEPVIVDRRVDVPTVHTLVGDRISGQIEFAGKGRRLVNTPEAPDFRLSRNTSVSINFKINPAGRPYDIVIPPLGSTEVEQALHGFVSNMRFSSVLYNEPDSATLKVTLRVR